MQSDIFRPLRLPAILVGDGRLGGITATIAAYESLAHRGYDVAAVAIAEESGGPNVEAVQSFLARGPGQIVPVFGLPRCQDPHER